MRARALLGFAARAIASVGRGVGSILSLPTATFLVGTSLLSVGLWLVSPALALIVLGSILSILGLVGSVPRGAKN